jgi:hypothetical protein
MDRIRPYAWAILLIASLTPAQFVLSAPQKQQVDPQALQLLQRALGVLEGRTAINDVVFTGTARRIAGSEDDTGSASLEATASGESSENVNLSSGTLKNIRTKSNGIPSGIWSGRDGVPHSISEHNLAAPACWFYPTLNLSAIVSNNAYVLSYLGEETLNGKTTYHIEAQKQIGETPVIADLERRLSRMDVFLDAATLLPVGLVFNEHPDDDARVDIPVRVEFSDYRSSENGAEVPFHVQKYINNSLVLDLSLEKVKFNTGLAISNPGIQ